MLRSEGLQLGPCERLVRGQLRHYSADNRISLSNHILLRESPKTNMNRGGGPDDKEASAGLTPNRWI
jgi:hypothetical protein